MKKIRATKIQNDVFRKFFSKKNRIRKRRVFLYDILEDLQIVCGYSPQQITDICYLISVDLSFNQFLGVTIENFKKYSQGFTGSVDMEVDKIVISLNKASLGLIDFFRRDEEYKVKYYHNKDSVLSTNVTARRF